MDGQRSCEYSRPPEIPDLLELCRHLNEHEVKYLVIGGFAVILQGLPRTTKDVDLLVDPDPENIRRLKKALAYLPDNAVAQVRDDEVGEVVVVRVADEFIIDLMAKACGIDFITAFQDHEYLTIEDLKIPIPSKRMLIRTKETYRPHDHDDVVFLKALLRKEGKNLGTSLHVKSSWRRFVRKFFP